MTPEAEQFLEKADDLHARAFRMLQANLTEDAGRAAYLAGFHAAQALIFERTGRSSKTHKGVHAEFLRLTKDDARFDAQTRSFLSNAYNLKSIADYETGPGSKITRERAERAIQDAGRFIATVRELIA